MTVRKSASIDSLTASIQCASSMMNSAGSVRASDAVLISAVNRRRRASGSIWGSGTSGRRCRADHRAAADPAGRHRRDMFAHPGAGGFAVEVGHAGARAQQPRHGVERDVTGVGFAEGPKHLDPATGRQRRGLPGHPALADARRSHHIHDTTAATDRAVHHGVERRHLPAPTDQARLGAPDQAIPRADRHQPARAHRFVGALDAHPLRVRQHHRCARPAARWTPTASPRRGAPPIPSAAPSRPCSPVAAYPSDPEPISPAITRPEFRPTRNRSATPSRRCTSAANRLRLLLDGQGGKAGPKSVILQRNWGTEHRHHPVAGVLHGPAVAAHHRRRALHAARS